MALGDKLKQARIQAGLSQRQLCQGIVTRNMLSQMENGAANPSLATLSALAGRLGKPLGYFLEEQEDPGHRFLTAAWACYEDGKMEDAWKNLEMMEKPQGLLFRDYALLSCLTCLELGDMALKNHQPHRAREAFSRVEALENQTGCPDYLRTRRLLLQGKENPAAWNALPSLDEILLAKGGGRPFGGKSPGLPKISGSHGGPHQPVVSAHGKMRPGKGKLAGGGGASAPGGKRLPKGNRPPFGDSLPGNGRLPPGLRIRRRPEKGLTFFLFRIVRKKSG